MRRSRRRTTGSVLAVLVIDSLTNGLFIPLSLLYLTARTGTSLAQVGVLLTAAGLVALPMPLWAGRLVDHWGAKRVVLIAQFLQGAGFLGYVLSSAPRAVLVAASVASVGRAVFWSSIFALIGGLSDGDPDPRARERWFGVSGALRAAGYGVGALVAGVALSLGSVSVDRWLIAGNAGLLLLAGVLLVLGVPRAAPAPAGRSGPVDPRGYRILLRDRPFIGLIAVNTVYALCNVFLSVGLPPFVARELPGLRWAVGPLLAMNTVVQAVLQPVVVRFTRGLARHLCLALAGGLWAVWALALLSSRHVPHGLTLAVCMLAVLSYSGAQMLHSPVSNALAADAAPVEVRGRYLAAFQYSFLVASVVAPSLFAVLLQVGAEAPWAVIALAALSSIPGVLIVASRLPRPALTGVTVDVPASPVSSDVPASPVSSDVPGTGR